MTIVYEEEDYKTKKEFCMFFKF